MTIFQIIILLAIAIILGKSIKRLLKKEISGWLLLVWMLFWLGIAIVDLFPKAIDYIAIKMGVGRGVDLLIYLALFISFYIIFKINIRLNKIEKQMAELAQSQAINNYLKEVHK